MECTWRLSMDVGWTFVGICRGDSNKYHPFASKPDVMNKDVCALTLCSLLLPRRLRCIFEFLAHFLSLNSSCIITTTAERLAFIAIEACKCRIMATARRRLCSVICFVSDAQHKKYKLCGIFRKLIKFLNGITVWYTKSPCIMSRQI
jgi:hypothetical protein